jgi:hypothetical protein
MKGEYGAFKRWLPRDAPSTTAASPEQDALNGAQK